MQFYSGKFCLWYAVYFTNNAGFSGWEFLIIDVSFNW